MNISKSERLLNNLSFNRLQPYCQSIKKESLEDFLEEFDFDYINIKKYTNQIFLEIENVLFDIIQDNLDKPKILIYKLNQEIDHIFFKLSLVYEFLNDKISGGNILLKDYVWDNVFEIFKEYSLFKDLLSKIEKQNNLNDIIKEHPLIKNKGTNIEGEKEFIDIYNRYKYTDKNTNEYIYIYKYILHNISSNEDLYNKMNGNYDYFIRFHLFNNELNQLTHLINYLISELDKIKDIVPIDFSAVDENKTDIEKFLFFRISGQQFIKVVEKSEIVERNKNQDLDNFKHDVFKTKASLDLFIDYTNSVSFPKISVIYNYSL